MGKIVGTMLANLNLGTVGFAIGLLLITYRVYIAIYRLYFHPLAGFPGPRFAAISTLYRAYYQVWMDGKMLEKATQLHDIYGPIIRFSPNELHFSKPTAFHDIYSGSFNGIKDPDFYAHLKGEDESFFTMGDHTQYKARIRPVASLFGKRHFDQCEPNIKSNVERFSNLLSVSAQKNKPVNLALGYRSLVFQIVADFVFSSIPGDLKCLVDENFTDPCTIATAKFINWTGWFVRNFPTLTALLDMVPQWVVAKVCDDFNDPFLITEILKVILKHEKDPNTPKHKDSMMQRLINAHLDSKTDTHEPYPDSVLLAEAQVTILGGIIDLANILPFGTYHVSQSPELQDALFEELKSIWPDSRTLVPSYEVLRHLPHLNGVVKESLRLTYGVIAGGARLVGEGGTHIDGTFVPANAVVTGSSYYVQMDPAVFPTPEKFDPKRWIQNDHSESIVAFSKGRRMCPAAHFSYMEMFATFATVFRRFRVQAYKTSIDDFSWNQYFSIQFNGRPCQALLEEREE